MDSARPTPGGWRFRPTSSAGGGFIQSTATGKMIADVTDERDGPLFAAAGTSANKLYERGINGIAAIEALGEIVEALEEMRSRRAAGIDFYNRNGPQWTSPQGNEYESTADILAIAEDDTEFLAALLSRIRMEAGDGEE